MDVVRGVLAVMVSAGQVHSWLVAVEARKLTRLSVHRYIRAMSMREGGRSRTGRHELLKMVPNTDIAAALVRACFELPCTLRGSAPARRSVGTGAAGANTTDLPDVVSAGEAPHFGAVLLLRRWSLPAGPGIVLLMPRMSPLLLPLGRLLLMVLWPLLLPRMNVLRTALFLVATSTIVVALG